VKNTTIKLRHEAEYIQASKLNMQKTDVLSRELQPTAHINTDAISYDAPFPMYQNIAPERNTNEMTTKERERRILKPDSNQAFCCPFPRTPQCHVGCLLSR
jgi:hypothetical protein